jgi:hypothetical protein|tara:strand:- start:354 stop:962 length:609 start_codon:yes stop_codon:yes gene_type:complete
MLKTLKEYISYMGGFRLGYVDNIQPMASLGDKPPKGQGGKDSRGVGLNANSTSQGLGTMKPFLAASKKKQKKKVKEDKEMEDFLNDLANNTPNEDQFEDKNRIARKPGQKAGSNKHSDLYTDENPKGTIHGLKFTDGEVARTSVNKIKSSGKTHAHKIQAAIAMSQRAKVASERAKDTKKKKDLGVAHKVYQSYIDTNKKDK